MHNLWTNVWTVLSVGTCLPTLAVYLLLGRYFMRGLLAGALRD